MCSSYGQQSMLKQQSDIHGSDPADISIHEIDSRIKQLQESLLRKSSEASSLQGTGGASLMQKT